jgi:hypothetical protein
MHRLYERQDSRDGQADQDWFEAEAIAHQTRDMERLICSLINIRFNE